VSNWKETARGRVRPLVLTLDRWGLSPMAVTIIGLVITLLGAVIVGRGHLLLGTIVFLLGSAFDMLDGALARLQGTVSARGAFMDSVLDRFGEAAFLTGLAAWYMTRLPERWDTAIVLILITMFGSLATSYVRARAEGVGETCFVGILQRTERVILLGIGALMGPLVLFGVLWLLTLGTVITTIQRIVHVAGKLPGPAPREERVPEPAPEKLEPSEDMAMDEPATMDVPSDDETPEDHA